MNWAVHFWIAVAKWLPDLHHAAGPEPGPDHLQPIQGPDLLPEAGHLVVQSHPDLVPYHHRELLFALFLLAAVEVVMALDEELLYEALAEVCQEEVIDDQEVGASVAVEVAVDLRVQV